MPVQPRSRGRLILESWSRGHSADLIEFLVAVELAEPQLSRRRQTVQQEQRAVRRGQHRLRLDPPAELLDDTLDDVGGAQPLPLAFREAVVPVPWNSMKLNGVFREVEPGGIPGTFPH